MSYNTNALQEQGRAFYKRGDYQKAVEHFDRAIGRAVSVQLLDNRAACYERLGDLQAALKDAKKAIQLQREDATGYLRAGRILVKMAKEPVALEIYTHGLRSIKHVGQGYELLRKAHKDVLDRVSPPKSVDPMTMLPRELAEVVLEYLTFKQRMNACLVSKQWSQFIQSCPDLWRHLDLSGARRRVKTAFISRAINVGRRKIIKATLSNLFDFDKALPALIKHCSLEELILDETGLQASNLTTALASSTHLKTLILRRGSQLSGNGLNDLLRILSTRWERIECDAIFGTTFGNVDSLLCPKLHTFSFGFDSINPALRGELVRAIPRSMPALQSLSIRARGDGDLAPFPELFDFVDLPLRHLDLRLPLRSAGGLDLPPSLITLKLDTTCGRASLNTFWPSTQFPDFFFLPRLEEIDLNIPGMILHNALCLLNDSPRSRSPFWDDPSSTKAVEQQAGPLSKVRKLSITGAKLNYRQISEFFQQDRLTDLELVHLPRLESCCDTDVAAIVDSLPNLQSLDLSETDITGIAVRRAVESAHVRELILNDCRKIGVDAIEWAREKGIQVKYRMSDEMSGGRKVRQ